MNFGIRRRPGSQSSWTRFSLFFTTAICVCVSSNLYGQSAQLRKALSIKPKQDVDYEQPSEEVMKECKLVSTKNPQGFIVHHQSGRILRRFVVNNPSKKKRDVKLDQWSYYRDGIEVYRDLDTNFDGKTDQYRWLGPAGTRWGLDNNQDGVIDSWKVISAEEVAYECFQAIKNRDQQRFNRLLLTPDEFTNLQLGSRIADEVKKRWLRAKSDFLSMARSQKAIDAKTDWVYAGNGLPSMLAAGSFGSKRDLMVYDHGSGFFQSGGVNQLALGTLVKVGSAWRMVELPEIVDPKKPLTTGGAFFPIPEFGGSQAANDVRDQKLSELYEQLADVEKKLESASGASVAKLEQEKADLLVQFYVNTTEPKAKQDWLETLADSVSSAFQSERFDDGLKYLKNFMAKNKNAPGLDYVQWRVMFAEYGWVNATGSRAQRDDAYEKLIDNLDGFQKSYPKSRYSGDALIQLAVHYEVKFSDEPEKAIRWYKICQQRYSDTKYGRRAQGALARLSGEGKAFEFKGQTASGQAFDLRRLRGKIVVLHFWETWCDDGLDELAKLSEKFSDDLVIVSCNIEDSTEKFQDYYKENRKKLTWTQLHAPGSVDESPLAHQLGVATEPMLILVDKAGKLVDSNLAFESLEREIERERRR